jgi:ligand-binding sensor domain-containing protein
MIIVPSHIERHRTASAARFPRHPRLIARVLLLLLLLISAVPASAQPRSYDFAHLSIEEGLSQSSVQQILQDRQGFIWLATQDGLNR